MIETLFSFQPCNKVYAGNVYVKNEAFILIYQDVYKKKLVQELSDRMLWNQ